MSDNAPVPEWSNWSGSLRFRPNTIAMPGDEAALVALVRRAAEERRTVRAVGAGHSSSPLVETTDVLVSLEKFQFDFYWYPRSDEAKLRTLNVPEQAPRDIPFAKRAKEKIGWSSEVLSRVRELPFDEMEYALPAEAGPECFREVRRRVKEKHRQYVGWRVLYRTIAPDDSPLSPAFGRETVTISLHQNAGLPFWEYFRDLEPIMRAYGGRPHWGKKHTLKAAELRLLYPRWDHFLQIRQDSDPEGVFLNPYLRALLGVE